MSEARLGVVIIGRNEGERLRACMESLLGPGETRRQGRSLNQAAEFHVVYVDSGSTDGSVELACSCGVGVVTLDLGKPFSAARARNEGLARLRELWPQVDLVQFVDGDCAVAPGWLAAARAFLETHPEYAVVCGRRRERFPEASIYNRLCDMEWNTPVGDALACGGDALMRIQPLVAVGGYDGSVIAGEEPELCVRLRRAGGKIWRLDQEMSLHDAAMLRFGQWWKRAVRAGYAYALGAWMHGKAPERHWVRETRSIWIWGFWLPLVMLVMTWPTRGLSFLLGLGYFVLAFRVFRHMRGRGFGTTDARLYAIFCVLAKFPHMQGQIRFWWSRMRTKPAGIIEYKSTEAVRT